MEKKLLPSYEPARLVKGADRWYIAFYAPGPNGKRKKYRPTFNLNRIHNLKDREKRAHRLVQLVNAWLEAGRPAWEFDELEAMQIGQLADMSLARTPVKEALVYIRDLKISGARKDSAKTYRSISRLFLAFMDSRGWGRIEIGSIIRVHAAAYLDHCLVDRKVSNTTYNNNLLILHSMFQALFERGYSDHNAFAGIKYRKYEKKKRRNFTPEEARRVIARIMREDELLFLGLILQYSCFLRPAELLRLRFRNIDLADGSILVESEQAKTHRERLITIPDEFIPYFPVRWMERFPDHYLIFGQGLAPHPDTPAGKSSMYRRHQKILQRMKKGGELGDVAGLTWYSWKDTGITDALEDLPILFVQDQAGHSSPKMTLKYRHRARVNEKIKTGFRNRLL